VENRIIRIYDFRGTIFKTISPDNMFENVKKNRSKILRFASQKK